MTFFLYLITNAHFSFLSIWSPVILPYTYSVPCGYLRARSPPFLYQKTREFISTGLEYCELNYYFSFPFWMGIELHTKFRLLHAALCFLSIVILVVLGVTNLSRDQPPPWIFLAPLILLCLAFILSSVFCIVRVVIRVNFPVVGFAAHGLASVLYAAAATILLYAFIFLPKSPLST